MPSQPSDWTLSPANQSPRMHSARVLHMHVRMSGRLGEPKPDTSHTGHVHTAAEAGMQTDMQRIHM